MAKASPLTQQIQAKLRERGLLDPDSRGFKLEDILAANVRRRAENKDPRGRKPLPPRLVLVGDSLFIRYLGEDHPTHVVLQPGMNALEAELAAEMELDRFIEKMNAENREEISPTDKTLKEINDKYIADTAGSCSFNTNKTRRRQANHLEKFFPVKCLGEIVGDSSHIYIAAVIEGVEDEEKRKTLHNSAIDRLRFQKAAIAHYYGSLTVQPETKRSYDIPRKFKRHSEVTLTFEQLQRLIKCAQGWSYDLETGKYTEDYDPDLVVVERWVKFYFYTGGRGGVLLPLRWAGGLDGSGNEGGCVDTKKGWIYRKAPGAEITNKRAEPAKLLGDLRQWVKDWEREDFENNWIDVFHDASGGEINDMRSRFDRVKQKAGLGWMRSHDLKHTGVTLLSHAGLDIVVIAEAMSTTAETLRKEYEHLNKLFMRPRTRASLNCDVSFKRLARTSPPDADGWKRRAALWKARQEAQKKLKKTKRKAKAAARRRVEDLDAAA